MLDTPLDREPQTDGRRSIKGVLIAIAVVALIVVVWGVFSRHRSEQALVKWTGDQAIRTVVTIRPEGQGDGGALTLPANMEALNSAALYSRTNGYVRQWLIDIGKPVRAGQVLAIIDSPEVEQQLAAARADLRTAKANELLAATTATRWQGLLKEDAVSKQETDERNGDLAAKRALTSAAAANVSRLEALVGFTRIVAPFSGIVTSRAAQVGQLVSVGNSSAPPLFTVSDITRMRIYVKVPQAYASQIVPGIHIALTVPEAPGRTYDAVLSTGSRSVDPQSGTVLVQLQADNPDGTLMPGSYAQALFPVSKNGSSLMIPASAVLYRSEGTLVATVDGNDVAHLQHVTIGRDAGDRLEVKAGLKVSDRVIDNPPESIREGERVQAKWAPANAKGAPANAKR